MPELYRRVTVGDVVNVGDEMFTITGLVGSLVRINYQGYTKTLWEDGNEHIGGAIISGKVEGDRAHLKFRAPKYIKIRVDHEPK